MICDVDGHFKSEYSRLERYGLSANPENEAIMATWSVQLSKLCFPFLRLLLLPLLVLFHNPCFRKSISMVCHDKVHRATTGDYVLRTEYIRFRLRAFL